MEPINNNTPSNKPSGSRAYLRLALVLFGCLMAAFACATDPSYDIDYTTHVQTFGTALKTVITTNLGPLFIILAMVVGFGFIWNHVKRLGRSL